MADYFSDSFRITLDGEYIRMAIATSDTRVDEIKMTEQEFRSLVEAIWNKSVEYRGCSGFKAKFQNEMFSLSIQTGVHTRSIYRLKESVLVPVIAQYVAEIGGI